MTNKEKFIEVFHMEEDALILRECPVYCTSNSGNACKHIKDAVCMGKWWNDEYKEENDDRLSSVTPQEPKIGHWIRHHNGIYTHLVCNKCFGSAPYDYMTNYCPHCGAKMVEPQESEDKDEHMDE